jgi:hypothetical protein
MFRFTTLLTAALLSAMPIAIACAKDDGSGPAKPGVSTPAVPTAVPRPSNVSPPKPAFRAGVPAKAQDQKPTPQAVLDAINKRMAKKIAESKEIGELIELRRKTLNMRKFLGDISPEDEWKENDEIFKLWHKRIDCVAEADWLFDEYYRISGKPKPTPAAKKTDAAKGHNTAPEKKASPARVPPSAAVPAASPVPVPAASGAVPAPPAAASPR